MRYLSFISISFFLTGACFFSACRKSDFGPKTIVQGHVTDRLTNLPLADIPIEIRNCDINSKCFEIRQNTRTDAQGFYSCTLNSDYGGASIVEIGENDVVASTYYRNKIKKGEVNIYDFSMRPFKILKLRIKISRHDKNYLYAGLGAGDQEGYVSVDYYRGPNPTVDFDSTFYSKVEAGRHYSATVGLSNISTTGNYNDLEWLYRRFPVSNADTTSEEFIVQ